MNHLARCVLCACLGKAVCRCLSCCLQDRLKGCHPQHSPVFFTPPTRRNVQYQDFSHIYYSSSSSLMQSCQNALHLLFFSSAPLRALAAQVPELSWIILPVVGHPKSSCTSRNEEQYLLTKLWLHKFWAIWFLVISIAHKLCSFSGTSGQPTAKKHP